MLFKWEPDEPSTKSSRITLFDGLLIIKCYQTGNGDWSSLALGAYDEDQLFGFYFKSELEAKQAAEQWLSQKLEEIKNPSEKLKT